MDYYGLDTTARMATLRRMIGDGPIAHLVEPPAHNRQVPGSSPGGPTAYEERRGSSPAKEARITTPAKPPRVGCPAVTAGQPGCRAIPNHRRSASPNAAAARPARIPPLPIALPTKRQSTFFHCNPPTPGPIARHPWPSVEAACLFFQEYIGPSVRWSPG